MTKVGEKSLQRIVTFFKPDGSNHKTIKTTLMNAVLVSLLNFTNVFANQEENKDEIRAMDWWNSSAFSLHLYTSSSKGIQTPLWRLPFF